MVALGPVPSLDEVARQPNLVLALPPSAVQEVMFKAMTVQEACFVALLVWGRTASTTPEPDKLLTAKEAAELLKISSLTLLRNRDRSPYRDFVVPAGARGRASRGVAHRNTSNFTLGSRSARDRAGVAAEASAQPTQHLRDRSVDKRRSGRARLEGGDPN